MSNLIFYPQGIEAATLTVTSEATGFLKANLQDRRKATSWKSTSSANQNIDMDFGAAYSVNHVLLYHNCPVDTTIRPYYATMANYNDEVAPAAAQIIDSSKRPFVLFTWGSTVSVRYWRLKITTLPSAAQIYLIFLGVRREITIRYNYNNADNNEYDGVSLVETFGGVRSARNYHGARRVFNLPWELLDYGNKIALDLAFDSAGGKRYPIFMSDPDGVYYFVRFVQDSVNAKEAAHELYNLGILLEEEL